MYVSIRSTRSPFRRMLHLSALAGLVLWSALALLPAAAAASPGIELFPFAGYTTKATIDGTGTILPGTLSVKGAFTAGVAVGTTTPRNMGFEAMYTYQATGITFNQVGSEDRDLSDMAIHQIHANFLLYPPGAYTAPTKPYFLIGLGASIFDPAQTGFGSETEFTWALGLGVKRKVSEKVMLRIQGRYTPTYLGSDYGGTWCDPYWGCYNVADPHYLDQWDFTGGLVFNLGGS